MGKSNQAVSLRWSLLRSFLLLVLLTSLTMLAVMQYRAWQSEQTLSLELTQRGLDLAGDALERFLEPARTGATLTAEWGRLGLLDLAPVVAATTIRVLELLDTMPELRARLWDNTQHFRGRMQALGFDLVPGEHAIIPIMLGDAPLALRMADRLLELGVYVIGFSYPVVPLGQARIRTQMSAGHSRAQVDQAIEAFATAGRELGIIR